MKKVAIITIESMNFGNRLQNYALQEVLELEKCEVKTLHRNIKNTGVKPAIKAIVQNLLQTKAAKFRQFDSFIDYSDITVTRDDYPNDLSKKFDYFIVGSDQVWNPHYKFVGTTDLLTFAKPEQRISYAASFGVDEIPDEKKEVYKENLKQFRALSVRENMGAEIIKELIGINVQVVLDPTMLLTREQWSKVEKKSKFIPPKKYVLVYFLGEKNSDFYGAIDYYKREFEIFDIMAIQKNGREIPVGPAEFLYLVHCAEIILTDSFHASVFSVLYHKRFISFKRLGIDMSSRIVSLANIIGANNNFDEKNNLDCSDGLEYEAVDRLIERKREKSIEFLKNALE